MRRLSGRGGGERYAPVQESRRAMTVEDRLEEGEVLAYLFHDAFQAREAIRTMTEAGIAHRMLDWHVVQPERPVSQTGLDLGLVVAQERYGVDAWRVDGTAGAVSRCGGRRCQEDADSMAVLSMYERGEALVAARALGEAKMSYLWRDGSEHGSDLAG